MAFLSTIVSAIRGDIMVEGDTEDVPCLCPGVIREDLSRSSPEGQSMGGHLCIGNSRCKV